MQNREVRASGSRSYGPRPSLPGATPKGPRSLSRPPSLGLRGLALLARVVVFLYLAFRARSG